MAVDLGIEHLTDIELIGRGGFSVVYAATDGRTGRRVAVKMIHAVNDRIERSFERERAVMARLSAHPNVVTLYDSGYSPDGRPYLSMELVEGGSLAQRVSRNGPLPWRVAVNLLLPIAEALEFAHRHQVLHRDVKPENILQTGDQARLTDFGIASLRDASGYTTTQVAASWGYTAPETLENQRDERSDLYSLGSTLHMLVTGVPPFAGDGNVSIQSLMYRLVNQPPPRLPPELGPAALDDVLQACLAKDPGRRPQTASALIEQLRPLLPASPAPPRRPVRAEPDAASVAAGPASTAEAAGRGTGSGSGVGPEPAMVTEPMAAGSSVSVSAWLRRLRTSVSPLAVAAVLVGAGAVALALSLTVGDPAPVASGPAPPGSAPAVGAGDVVLTGHRGTVARLVALPDGRLVSAGDDRTVRVWDPARPDVFPIVLRGGLSGPVADLAALSDGGLALVGADGAVTIWQPDDRDAEPVTLPGPTGPVTRVVALADGRLVSAGADGTPHLSDPADPAADPVVLPGAEVAVTALAALADGRVAGGTADGTLLVWDPTGPDAPPAVVSAGHEGAAVTGLVQLSDGRLASAGADGTVGLWDLDAPAGGPGPVFRGHTGPVTAVAALGDRRVASAGADGSVQVWDPDEIPLGVRTTYRPEGPLSALAVLPDGRLATAGADDWAIHVWPAPSAG